jgi:FkbM family methyltransferase
LREARGDWSRSRPAIYELDQVLERYLDFDGGFFVEAGALDGYFQSNTYRLERMRRWRGILVEPTPHMAREAARERRAALVFNCALVDSDFDGDHMTLRYRAAMTSVTAGLENSGSEDAWSDFQGRPTDAPEHEFTVPARTLSAILDEVQVPKVDFLSLDVEGYEPQALAGLDLARHAPSLMLIEVGDDPAREHAVRAVLGDRYEEVERVTPLDVLFRTR